MTEEANVISIDGTDYKESDLSDRQKYLVRHIKELQSEVAGKKFDLERLEAAMTHFTNCLLYTSPSPRDGLLSRMPSSA